MCHCGHINPGRNATEAAVEFDTVVGDDQPLDGNGRDVQDDLPVLDVVLGDLNILGIGIDQNVGRAIILKNPFIERPYHVGAMRSHCHGV